jgi:hypothetical protein
MSEWIYCKDEMPPLNIKIFFAGEHSNYIGQREYLDEYGEDFFVSYDDDTDPLGIIADEQVLVWMLYPKIMKPNERNVKDDETCKTNRTTSTEKT